ncbi:hypothetical protein T4B_12333 [Trichinella pseudospiralis]|uniref:Uncharacterized protein n=1 Tax=Trichinella pseudospiralis TaxID=6337 RepID=A0A0V1IVY6_TRIPS|nr:hypothetical protein T4B_12333 [Trichinella pseudospiralis]
MQIEMSKDGSFVEFYLLQLAFKASNGIFCQMQNSASITIIISIETKYHTDRNDQSISNEQQLRQKID